MSLNIRNLAARLFQRFTKKSTLKAVPNRTRLNLTLLEDRTVPTPVVTIAEVTGIENAVEGVSSGLSRFTRTGDLTGPLTVYFDVSGTATEGSDYTALAREVTFPAGEATVDVAIVPIDDSIAEPTETVTITLPMYSPNNYDVGESDTALVTIADTETPLVGLQTDANALEGVSDGRIAFTRLGDLRSELTVTIAVSGTATSGTDFTSLGTTVTFPVGEADTFLDVEALTDSVYDPNETIVVTLQTGTGYERDLVYSATLTIEDAIPLVTVEKITDAWEDGEREGRFLFRRTGDLTDSLTVNYTISGSATADDDYKELTGSVEFAAGESEVEVVITPVDDTAVDPNEVVALTLQPVAAYVVGTSNAASVQIFDNEIRPASLPSALPVAASVRLESMTFDTSHPAIVGDPGEDGNSVLYSGPQYFDADHDGSGERAYPTSFTRNEYLKVSAVFRLADDVSGPVWIRGSTQDGNTLPATLGFVSANGTVSVNQLQANQPFGNSIQAYDNYQITWEFTLDPNGQNGWQSAGNSDNSLYLTFATPTTDNLFDTVISAAAHAAAGLSEEVQLAACIFGGVFSGRDVQTKSGQPLYYYKNWLTSSDRYGDFLMTRDGKCGAWAKFFADTLKGMGATLPDKPYAMLTPDGAGGGFLLNDAVYCPGQLIAGQPGYPNPFPANYPYFNTYKKPGVYKFPYTTDRYIWGEAVNTGAEVNVTGAPPAQNNTNPLTLFNNHVTVYIGGTYYDPSFGVTYSTLQEFDEKIAFFFKDPEELRPKISNAAEDRRFVYFFQDNPAGLSIKATFYSKSWGAD